MQSAKAKNGEPGIRARRGAAPQMAGDLRKVDRNTRTRKRVPRAISSGALAGAHLLTVPRLTRNSASLHFQGSWKRDRLAKLLGLRLAPEDRMDDLLNRTLFECGIGADRAPLTYSLNISNFDNAMAFYEDDLSEDDRIGYLGLFFVTDTFTNDYGAELEDIERRHPGLGRWLLRQLDKSPCNILTPRTLYKEAEMLLNWNWSEKDQKFHYELEDAEDAITPEAFCEYYPQWAYEDYDDPAPDLTPWPQLVELEQLLDGFFESQLAIGNRNLLIPSGADMYGGVLAWTCGRCEVENDLAYRACDEFYTQMAYSVGTAPGCVEFEFLFNDASAADDRRSAESLKCFCRYLTTLDDVMDNIEEGAFR